MGRVLYDGRHVRVERYDTQSASYILLGHYEDTIPSQLTRKHREIDDIFDAWRAIEVRDPRLVQVRWKKRDEVPDFNPLPARSRQAVQS